MIVSILFRPKNRVQGKIFRTFREFFSNFSPSRKFFDGPNFFQNLADSAAIRLVQKSSKSEPSSPFFGRLKFRGKYELLQNFLCGYKIEMAICVQECIVKEYIDLVKNTNRFLNSSLIQLDFSKHIFSIFN